MCEGISSVPWTFGEVFPGLALDANPNLKI
jgi:hypothetical protein